LTNQTAPSGRVSLVALLVQAAASEASTVTDIIVSDVATAALSITEHRGDTLQKEVRLLPASRWKLAGH
jgi:uncharacterized protein (DUF1778 family)